jgi:hypothetical protein
MVIIPIQIFLTTIANLENITYTILMGKYFNHRIKLTVGDLFSNAMNQEQDNTQC